MAVPCVGAYYTGLLRLPCTLAHQAAATLSCWALNRCLLRKKSINKVQHIGSDRPKICLTWLALLWPRSMSRLRMPAALACAGRFSCAIWSGTPVRLVTVKCGSSQIACEEVLGFYVL